MFSISFPVNLLVFLFFIHYLLNIFFFFLFTTNMDWLLLKDPSKHVLGIKKEKRTFLKVVYLVIK